MFNVFLPKLLESTPSRSAIIQPKSLEESLWDVVVFTIGGCPGAIVRRLLPMYRHVIDSRLVWRTPHRVFVRPQVVLGREYSCYWPHVHHLYDGAIGLGCPPDDSWHQSECFGTWLRVTLCLCVLIMLDFSRPCGPCCTGELIENPARVNH